MNQELERLLLKHLSENPGNVQAPSFGLAKKEANLTLSTLPGIYNTGLFGMCGSNDLLSLTLEDEPFLDWLGWKADNQIRQFIKMITYVGPSGTAAGSASTGVAGPCDDPNGVEFGKAEILLPDKGRIKRAGPVRDVTDTNRKICDEYPVFTKSGQQIGDELMWSLTLAGVALKQDLKRLVINGNASTPNEFDGLARLVNTGYRDAITAAVTPSMDSFILPWANNVMTWKKNGTHALVDYIIDIVRRIRTRASWSSLGGIAVGDQVLVMPTFLRDQLLDTYTFWSVQPGIAYNEVNLNNYEARTYRNQLNGGTFGQGQIYVDGTPIPILTYDWNPVGQVAPNFTGDIYILTRRIGNVPVLWGQYVDMTQPAARFSEEAGYAHYKALDGGKWLGYWKTDNECVQSILVMRPNIYLSAPWAQARITGVAAMRPLAPISPDPTNAYYAESRNVAVSPTSYLVGSPA